jgi:hypothetical protein
VSITCTSSEVIDRVASRLAYRFELNRLLGGHIIREPISAVDRLNWQIIQELRNDALSDAKELSESLCHL